MIIPRTSSEVTSDGLTMSDHAAVIHDADPVGQVEHVVDIVADQEDADAFRLELADKLCTWAVSAGPSAAVGSSMIRILALK